MYVGRTFGRIKEKLKSYGVIVYDIPNELIRYNIQNSRWKIYEDYLKENKDKYNMIFTADIKDTFFQKDVFKYFQSDKSFLGVFYEEHIIKDRPMNCDWVRFYSGQEILEKIYFNRIICSGTLIGTVDKFIEFCNVLWKTMVEKNDLIAIHDQGAANYIIYYHKYFNDCLISRDNYGPVMTIGLSKRENLTLDQNDNLINYNGQIAAVVHQYNRHNDIVNKMNIKFNDDNYKSNFNYINTNNNKSNENLNIINENNTIEIQKGNIYEKGNIYIYFIRFFFFCILLAINIIVFYCLYSFIKRRLSNRKSNKKFMKVKIRKIIY